ESAGPKFADIKQQAKAMAEVIKQVHEFQRRQPTIQPVDLNPLVKQAVDTVIQNTSGEAGTRTSIQLDLSAHPAQVSGSRVDLQVLLGFLLGNRLTASGPENRTVHLRTKVTDVVLFAMEDSLSNLPASALTCLFDGDVKGLEMGHRLELTACKAIVRRNQGRIRAHASERGGLIIEAMFPRARDIGPN